MERCDEGVVGSRRLGAGRVSCVPCVLLALLLLRGIREARRLLAVVSIVSVKLAWVGPSSDLVARTKRPPARTHTGSELARRALGNGRVSPVGSLVGLLIAGALILGGPASVRIRIERGESVSLSFALFFSTEGEAKPKHNGEPGASPALPDNPWSPEEVSRRQSELRRRLGLNADPDTPIPDQPPGHETGGHAARPRVSHDGQRNIGHKRSTTEIPAPRDVVADQVEVVDDRISSTPIGGWSGVAEILSRADDSLGRPSLLIRRALTFFRARSK